MGEDYLAIRPRRADLAQQLLDAIETSNRLLNRIVIANERAAESRPARLSADEWLTPEQLVARCGGSVKTLARWRSQGIGPPYTKGPHGILYHWPTVQRWLMEGGRRRRRWDTKYGKAV